MFGEVNILIYTIRICDFDTEKIWFQGFKELLIWFPVIFVFNSLFFDIGSVNFTFFSNHIPKFNENDDNFKDGANIFI